MNGLLQIGIVAATVAIFACRTRTPAFHCGVDDRIGGVINRCDRLDEGCVCRTHSCAIVDHTAEDPATPERERCLSGFRYVADKDLIVLRYRGLCVPPDDLPTVIEQRDNSLACPPMQIPAGIEFDAGGFHEEFDAGSDAGVDGGS